MRDRPAHEFLPRRPAAGRSVTDAVFSARLAGLRYTSDQTPGLRRRETGTGFAYFDAHGRTVRDPAVLRRIRALVIPPAWREVWISPFANGHLQATGRDGRGRKQFRYHARWREVRDAAKYHRTLAFGRALPRIRARVARDAGRPGLGRAKVIAVMIRLLETTQVRVGNEEYLRQNQSVGLSTMRNRHAQVHGARLRFVFRGKSGKQHDVELNDRRIARVVRRLQELPGQELFQYVDAEGRPQTISSHDVNAYLHEIAGEEFSAKDFRTWAGTVFTAVELGRHPRAGSVREAKRQLVATIRNVAQRLGNTPAICRRCYIHPVITESFLDGHVVRFSSSISLATIGLARSSVERRVLRFLQGRLRARETVNGAPRATLA